MIYKWAGYILVIVLCIINVKDVNSANIVVGAESDGQPIPSYYVKQSHSFAWRADGSSSTQGLGSLSDFNQGTASCLPAVQVTQNQINNTAIPEGGAVTIPGSGTFIQKTCSGGAGGGTVQVSISMPNIVFGSNTMIGMFYFASPGYNTGTNGLTFYLCSTTCGNRLALYQNATTTYQHRQEGWNLGQGLCNLVFPDWSVEAGAVNCGSTITNARVDISVDANMTVVLYFGDLIYNYLAKAQIMPWSADNDMSVYTTMWPYMNAINRSVVGSYGPTSGEFGGGNLTTAELLQIRSSGWGVYGHQSNSSGLNYATMTNGALDTELQLVRSQLSPLGINLFNAIYVYPGGNRNANSDAALLRNGFSGVAVGGNSNNENNGRPVYGGMYNNKIWSVSGDAQSAALTKAAIDHAVLYGEQLAILWHIVPTASCDVTCFQTTIDYLVSLRSAGKIDIITFDGLVRH